ncbi:MAG: DUF58 domain-containing protein [Kineosporiaceae bacterium]
MALTGRAALFALLGVIPVALVPGWATLLGWAGLLVAGIAADLLLAGSPKALRIEREPLPPVRLGEPAAAAMAVANTGTRKLRGVLRDAWQPSAGARRPRHPLLLPAGQRTRLVTELHPTRRGDRQVDGVTVRSVGPFGLAARQTTLPVPGRLRVLPPFNSRKHLPSKLAQLRELDGRTALQVRGQGTEFDSVREYVIGDDVRSIDWRATARRHQVVVRTWRPERDRRVFLVLDTSRMSAARVGDEPRLDAAMEAALLLAALAARAGDRVDLIAMDRRVRARVEGASRTAPLPPSHLTAAVGHRRHNQRASHHQVVLASVADPQVQAMATGRGDSYAVYGAAAAERARLDRTALTAELARAGVEVVDAVPEELPPQLSDRYLALKAAGRL